MPTNTVYNNVFFNARKEKLSNHIPNLRFVLHFKILGGFCLFDTPGIDATAKCI